MPSTSLRSSINSNPPPSYNRATTLPSYGDFTKNHIRRQQSAIFNQRYRVCEQLVYNFIETGQCPECLRLGSPSTIIKNRTCKHVINATCYIETMNIIQILCSNRSIYYGDKNHNVPLDKADMPLSSKFKLMRHLPEFECYEKCIYHPKKDRWGIYLK